MSRSGGDSRLAGGHWSPASTPDRPRLACGCSLPVGGGMTATDRWRLVNACTESGVNTEHFA